MSFEGSYNGVFVVYRAFGLVPFKFHFRSITMEPVPYVGQKICLLLIENLWFICMLSFELYNLISVLITRYQFLVKCECLNAFVGFRFLMTLIFRGCVIVITLDSYFSNGYRFVSFSYRFYAQSMLWKVCPRKSTFAYCYSCIHN